MANRFCSKCKNTGIKRQTSELVCGSADSFCKCDSGAIRMEKIVRIIDGTFVRSSKRKRGHCVS